MKINYVIQHHILNRSNEEIAKNRIKRNIKNPYSASKRLKSKYYVGGQMSDSQIVQYSIEGVYNAPLRNIDAMKLRLIEAKLVKPESQVVRNGAPVDIENLMESTAKQEGKDLNSVSSQDVLRMRSEHKGEKVKRSRKVSLGLLFGGIFSQFIPVAGEFLSPILMGTAILGFITGGKKTNRTALDSTKEVLLKLEEKRTINKNEDENKAACPEPVFFDNYSDSRQAFPR